MYYQHNRTTPYFSSNATQYLKEQFPDQWISHGGMQNRLLWSLGLTPLDYHVWGRMKHMVYEHNVDTRELLQHISDAASCVNDAAVLCITARPLIKEVRMCIQPNGGHFEKLPTV
jgi:hypothetical protein